VLRDFRDFVTRGSVVELAVAVVVAVALVSLLKSLVVDVVTPLVGVAGGLDFGALSVTLRGSEIRYGAFLNELLSFLLTAAAVFFGVVKPLGAYQRRRQLQAAPVATAVCPRCLSTVPAAASRCPFCTSELAPSA
jgi:large conductance mechanosensitive channel